MCTEKKNTAGRDILQLFSQTESYLTLSASAYALPVSPEG